MGRAATTHALAWRDLNAKLGRVEFTRKVTAVYRSRAPFAHLLEATMPGRAPQPPPVDFGRREVVVVSLGPRSSTGYSLRVERVVERRREIDVYLRERDARARRSGRAARHVSVPRDHDRAHHQARVRQAAGETVTENDPLIRQLREQISDNDRAIVEAMNARLKLVARLKGYKESRGLSFVDPDREQWMLQYLARANRGPLSSDGLQELFDEILALTKREVERRRGD